jgi:hypothetical protein
MHMIRGVVVAAGVALTVCACSGDDGGAAAAGSPAVSGSAAPSGTATPSGPTATAGGTARPTAGPTAKPTPGRPATRTPGPSVAVTPLPPAPVGKDAALLSGVAISVTGVKDVEVQATGPGEIAGHGVAVSVRVRNSGSAAFDLSGLAVVASYGKNTPAEESGSAQTKALTGSLPTGRTAEGTYYFLVPAKESGTLKVQVSSSSAANIAVFQR